jgi:hypothetical protein
VKSVAGRGATWGWTPTARGAARAPALPLRALDHLEEAQGARQDAGRVFRLELHAQPGQQLGKRVVELDLDGADAARVHQLFTSPRAKIDATKLSTSVALTSS